VDQFAGLRLSASHVCLKTHASSSAAAVKASAAAETAATAMAEHIADQHTADKAGRRTRAEAAPTAPPWTVAAVAGLHHDWLAIGPPGMPWPLRVPHDRLAVHRSGTHHLEWARVGVLSAARRQRRQPVPAKRLCEGSPGSTRRHVCMPRVY